MITDKQKNKEKEERKYLDRFLRSSVGQLWLQENLINQSSLQKSEEPDFLFTTKDNKIIGVEITKLIVPNENTKATQQLITIGNQVRAYVKKKYNFDISLIVDWYDKRKWSCKWSDLLDAAYHPGFCTLPPYEQLKTKIIEGIDSNIEQIKRNTFSFTKFGIEIEGELFQITAEAWINPFENDYDVHVNNVQRCIENPIKNLQREINKKNKKYDNYIKNCDKCFLLIVIPDCREGCSCHFDELSKHHFKIEYNEVFLYNSALKECNTLKKSFYL